MRFSSELEKYRIKSGNWKSPAGVTYGSFLIPIKSYTFKVLACDGDDTGWEHVSVSLPNRCPNWQEMCAIKDLFWSEDETVFQFHPKKSDYVNIHPHCLHMWKPVGKDIELPPSIMV